MTKTAIAIQSEARKLAERIEADSKLNSMLNENVEHKETLRNLPLRFKLQLADDFGDDLDSLPEPDSEGGNNPDKYQESIPNGKGGSRTRNGSYYSDLANGMPFTQKCIKMKERIDNALSSAPAPENADLVKLGKSTLTAMQKRENQRINACRQIVKQAARLIFQDFALAEYEGVEVSIDMRDGKITDSTFPIIVKDTSEEGQKNYVMQRLGVNEYLNLNVGRAQELGGGYANLLISSKREPRQKGAQARIKTVETFEEYVAETTAFVDTKANREKLLVALAKKDEDTDGFVKSIGDLYFFLDGHVMPKIRERYKRLIEAEDKAEAA